MPNEITISSFECDCAHQSHFGVSTIWEVKAKSVKKTIHLYDSEPDDHTIVFHKGPPGGHPLPKTRAEVQHQAENEKKQRGAAKWRLKAETYKSGLRREKDIISLTPRFKWRENSE